MKKLFVLSGLLIVLGALLVPMQAFAAQCACQSLCCPIRATCETPCCLSEGWTTCGGIGMPGCGEIPVGEPHSTGPAAFGLFIENLDETPAFLQQEEQTVLNLEPTDEEPAAEE